MTNKYQEALDRIKNKKAIIDGEKMTIGIAYSQTFPILQELVDKETPIKPIVEDAREIGYSYGYSYICPKCNEVYVNVVHKYCNNCGQKLDWRDEHDR